MGKYFVSFHGRGCGSLGADHQCSATVQADDADGAIIALYATHEHISDAVVTALHGYDMGQTIRTVCGTGRATYRPDWSAATPWVTYINGTAGLHVATLDGAARYFARYGMTLNTEK